MARQPNRNRRSQDPSMLVAGQPIIATVSSAGANTMGIAFDRPCSINGTLQATVATRTIVSQTIVDLQHITILFSGTIAAKAYTVPGGADEVRASDGGRLAANSGTFS